MDEYKLIGFDKSKRKNKKYDAILLNKQTKKTIRIPFGDTSWAIQGRRSTFDGIRIDWIKDDSIGQNWFIWK